MHDTYYLPIFLSTYITHIPQQRKKAAAISSNKREVQQQQQVLQLQQGVGALSSLKDPFTSPPPSSYKNPFSAAAAAAVTGGGEDEKKEDKSPPPADHYIPSTLRLSYSSLYQYRLCPLSFYYAHVLALPSK